jgi:hypothetical protein
MNQEEQSKKISRLIARCWMDEKFKQLLLAEPMATLQAEGVELPAGLSVVAVENTAEVFHLVIPAKPTDLTDEELDEVNGGIGWHYFFRRSHHKSASSAGNVPVVTPVLGIRG